MSMTQMQAAAIAHRRVRYARLRRLYRYCETLSKLGLYLLCLLVLTGAPYPFQLAGVISLAVLSHQHKAFSGRCRREL